MSTTNLMNEIVDNYMRHAQSDYVGLWQIAGRVRDEFGLHNDHLVRAKTLDIVTRLVERGLRPGDYSKTGFHFWNEDNTDSVISRIVREWDALTGDPTLAKPICWFDLKKN